MGLSLLTGVAVAQPIDAMGVARSFYPGTPMLVADAIDLDRNGSSEVLVQFPQLCQQRSCEWSLLAELGEGWVEVTRSRAAVIDVVESSAGLAVSADGVTWGWDGSTLFPTEDMLVGRFEEATVEDLALAYDLFGFSAGMGGSVPAGQIARADLDGDGSAETVTVINDHAWMMEGVYSPFVVMNEAGEKLVSGFSMDAPRLFPGTGETAFSVVSVTPAGVQVLPIARK
jgi:hypothetical protein